MAPKQQEARTTSHDHEPEHQNHDEYYNSHPHMTEIDPHEPVLRRSVYRRESFLVTFATSDGPPQIVILMLLLALGFGSTIGVVPAVMSDRYARLNHGYTDDRDCSLFGMDDKPDACLAGSSDAQNAAAMSNLISNGLTFLTSSLMGSISDERGRRGLLILGTFLATLYPLCLVLLQIYEHMNPFWYYAAGSMNGIVNWVAVALSALSDVMPPKWRAPSFGLLLAGFSLGFALAPLLAIVFNHFQVSVFSFSLMVIGFVLTVAFFPETLPPGAAAEAARIRQEQYTEHDTVGGKIIWSAIRPLRELSILNRNQLFRLLSVLAFFSGMVTSADHTLLIYYVEERLAFDDHDVAVMFMIVGILGIVVQGVLLKPLNDCLGERYVIVVAFFVGAFYNLLYGLAKDKTTIFIAVSLSTFLGMSFPTISAIKSNNVDESEQGRIQGALYSLSALASGLGPVLLRIVYSHTKSLPYPGPGSMFIFAAFLFLVATGFAFALPKDKANSRNKSDEEQVSILDEEEIDMVETYGTSLL
mmetsp:Transcript_5533/g.10131  ORF Transcript_5533/g.10131 Transcript_5533/m.10131 type:complete len:529 (+) Transcript_5533:180-1766(+)